MQEDTPLSSVINRLKDLRAQDRRNAAEAYAAAAEVVHIAEKSIETSSELIQEFFTEEQKLLPEQFLSEKLKEIDELRKSQLALQQFNDGYRVQRELTLQLLRVRNVSPEILAEVETLNDRKSISIGKRIALFEQQVGWERSKIIRLIKKYVRYSKIRE
jgi:alpha-amylase/alpha-mannosidase (GH57 family)